MKGILTSGFWISMGIGVLCLIPLIQTCERFAPAGEIYIYTDTITGPSTGTYLFSGGLLNVGRKEINQHGFCWSVEKGPTLDQGAFNMRGQITEPGEFSTIVTGLLGNTTYYVRAYATTDAGTQYSNEKWFATPAPNLPTITTAAVSNITHDSAWSGGTITDNGGSTVTARGVCWDTTEAPSIMNDHTVDGSGLGSYTSTITGIECATTYYVRAYATNEVGTSYGTQESFVSGNCIPSEPEVHTADIVNITHNAAQSGGSVTDEGTSAVEARGVCWSTSPNPTLTDYFSMDGTGTGDFTSNMTDLSPGTLYYVRAYATNAAGTGYGNEVNFTTLDIPTVTTDTITGITINSAEGRGEVVSDGGDPVTSRGLCWSINPNPTTSDFTTNEGTGTGSFTSSMTDLALFTRYYVRAYAENSIGIAYGEEISFRTAWDNSTVTDIDGNVYSTVGIGDQIWLARNLGVTQYADGTEIPLVEGTAEWDDLDFTDVAYCWYDNLPAYGDAVGALYTWAAAARGDSSQLNPSGLQGVCPDGWHLPSDEEWMDLEVSLGMSLAETDIVGYRGTDEGGQLKETGNDYWTGDNVGATNSTGFTGRGSGIRDFNGNFNYYRQVLPMWSSTNYDSSRAWVRALYFSEMKIDRNHYVKSNGYSVRCVKD